MMSKRPTPSPFAIGDWVIYRKQKRGNHPGPRAKIVGKAAKGDSYAYLVDKYWVVVGASDSSLTLRTRRGKLHTLDATDPRLRKAHWWERWTLSYRFRQIDATPLPGSGTSASEEILDHPLDSD